MRVVAVVGATVPSACSGDAPPTSGAPRNAAPLRFADATGDAGLGFLPDTATWGAAAADFDGDGSVDVFVGRHKRRALLLRGEVKGFTRVAPGSADFGPPAHRGYYDRHGCMWGEANGDARPDLYCVSGAKGGAGSGENQLHLQGATGFSLARAAAGAGDELGRGRSANWIDYDRDGDLDLFVANEERPGHPNALFENAGGRFTRVDAGLEAVMGSTASSSADWDRDADADLLVLGHGFAGSKAYENLDGLFRETRLSGISGDTWEAAAWSDFDADGWPDVAAVADRRVVILHNEAGTFREAFSSETARAARAVVWLDIENDGDRDLFVVQGEGGEDDEPGDGNRPDFFLVNRGSAFVRAHVPGTGGPRSGDGESAVATDFDRDGLTDLLVTNGYFRTKGPVQLLDNHSRSGTWVAVRLLGGAGNPFGFGASIEVRTSARTFWAQVTDSAASRSQSEVGYVTVGIGAAQPELLVVHWPDGSMTCAAVEARSVFEAARAAGPAGRGCRAAADAA